MTKKLRETYEEGIPMGNVTKRVGQQDFLAQPMDYRESWRIFRIMAELVEGFQFLSKIKNEVTILGSARFKEGSSYYNLARELAGLLAKSKFSIITGGGPGIMEAANQGAVEGKGESIGLNIQLPFEQRINPYVKKSIAFYYFFTRKVMLTSPANAFVFFPGGFGTMDEFFEVVDLMDLGIMQPMPIVLVGSEFWQPLVNFIKNYSCKVGSNAAKSIEHWHIVDTAEEAFKIIKNTKDRKPLNYLGFYGAGSMDWKIFRVMAELVSGFEFITGLTQGVTILGTKGIHSKTNFYKYAFDLGSQLAKRGKMVVTGGKFGIAEAANKGAFINQGDSIGIGMKIGKSTEVNKYTNKTILFEFPFVRQLVVTAPSKAFVVFPGSLGTLHQLFEILTLIQTKKIKRRPVILFNHDFWQPLHDFIKQKLAHDEGTISDEDDEIYQIVDDVKSIIKIIDGK